MAESVTVHRQRLSLTRSRTDHALKPGPKTPKASHLVGTTRQAGRQVSRQAGREGYQSDGQHARAESVTWRLRQPLSL